MEKMVVNDVRWTREGLVNSAKDLSFTYVNVGVEIAFEPTTAIRIGCTYRR